MSSIPNPGQPITPLPDPSGQVEQGPTITENSGVFHGSRLAAKIRQMKFQQTAGVLSLALILGLGAGLVAMANKFSAQPARSQAAASPSPTPTGSPVSTPLP